MEEVTVVGYALSRGTEVQFCLLSSLFSFSLLRDVRLVDSRQAFLYFGETSGLLNFFKHFLLVFQTFQKEQATALVFHQYKVVLASFRLAMSTMSRTSLFKSSGCLSQPIQDKRIKTKF